MNPKFSKNHYNFNSSRRTDCESNAKITAIFDDLWFKLYFVDEYVDLSDPTLYLKTPIKTKVKYI
jgi:hypothetical protein